MKNFSQNVSWGFTEIDDNLEIDETKNNLTNRKIFKRYLQWTLLSPFLPTVHKAYSGAKVSE